MEGIFSRSLQDFITDSNPSPHPPKKQALSRPALLASIPSDRRIPGWGDWGQVVNKTVASTSFPEEWGNSNGSPPGSTRPPFPWRPPPSREEDYLELWRTSLTWLREKGVRRGEEGRAGMGYEGGKWRGAVPKGGARTEGAPGSATSGDTKRTAPRGASKAAAGRSWDRVEERLKVERSGV